MSVVRIAIVDDHAIVRASLAKLLQSDPTIELIGTAGDGKGAIELVRRLKPDLLLLDISMPDLNGLRAIPLLQGASPTTRILLISMHDEPEYLQEAVAKGAQGLISKASSPEDLIEAILTAAQGKVMHVPTPLSEREREVLSLIGEGKTNEEIAISLSISQKTVEHHRQQLMNKLNIHTEAALIVHAKRTHALS
jgi:DNA-binding NarL/FixJ family response regulator